MMTTADRRPAPAPRRSRVRFLSQATLRAMIAAHDAMVCLGWHDAAAALLSGLHNGDSLVTTVRRLNVSEWHATSVAEDAAEIGDTLRRHRATVCADLCGQATRLLLADYEREAERD